MISSFHVMCLGIYGTNKLVIIWHVCLLSFMLNAHLPTENRRSSVGVYQTATRSSGLIGAIPPIRNLNRRKSQSALVGRCVPNVNPIVGANRQVCIEFRLDSTVGGKLTNHSYHFRARLDLAAIFASTGIDYFTHFRHFCFVVSILPRLKHHSTSFQMQKLPLATYMIAFYGSMQTFTLITLPGFE